MARLEGGDPFRAVAIGCGGAGCNTLASGVPGATPLAFADRPHPSLAGIPNRLLIDKRRLQRAAASPSTALVDKDLARRVEERCKGFDFCALFVGLGGETGTAAAEVAADVASEAGLLALAVCALPFNAEGLDRRRRAREAVEKLRGRADGVLLFPNDGLLKLAPQLPILQAFGVMSRLMVKPIASLLAVAGKEDERPLQRFFGGATSFAFGLGEGWGPHAITGALEEAATSPWCASAGDKATAAAVFIESSWDVPDAEKEIRSDILGRYPDADIVWGVHRRSVGGPMRATLLLGSA